ncbi:hypothetical protein [Achromobacter aloeverae]|uniref:Uncharacterized protein n=1 Tax=Achromobacter aloeverae TaxID=1750518 RepID=A0A4Q1HFE0_9BURK|nr:hypothetical protein [Achromobacter aloeverae]RXN85415.1 hypothetical protein C7R54_23310 [Achromobacter aloeverae]
MFNKAFNKALVRAGEALFLVGLVAGCSWGGSSSSSSRTSLQCAVSKSSCMYDGPYEPGEADYAESEAAKLNSQQQVRLRGR